jgi:hypothetical protein
MELNESLYSYLTSVAALTALVSTRIYPDRKSESTTTTYPYVTYELVSETEVETLELPTTVMLSPVYQFDVWASSRSSARNVAKQLRKALKNLSGQIGGATGVTVSAVRKISHTTDLEERDGVVVAYRDIQEFEISYNETT